jgi:hypothetical protein
LSDEGHPGEDSLLAGPEEAAGSDVDRFVLDAFKYGDDFTVSNRALTSTVKLDAPIVFLAATTQRLFGFTIGRSILKDKVFAFGRSTWIRYYGNTQPNPVELPDAGYARFTAIGGPLPTQLQGYLLRCWRSVAEKRRIVELRLSRCECWGVARSHGVN